ncbi:MAG: hypothetical protein JWM11_3704 [Planctomycetaceae bacterium]|nr:hypothetical protein [Planctomycetaceae bacterium]
MTGGIGLIVYAVRGHEGVFFNAYPRDIDGGLARDKSELVAVCIRADDTVPAESTANPLAFRLSARSIFHRFTVTCSEQSQIVCGNSGAKIVDLREPRDVTSVTNVV